MEALITQLNFRLGLAMEASQSKKSFRSSLIWSKMNPLRSLSTSCWSEISTDTGACAIGIKCSQPMESTTAPTTTGRPKTRQCSDGRQEWPACPWLMLLWERWIKLATCRSKEGELLLATSPWTWNRTGEWEPTGSRRGWSTMMSNQITEVGPLTPVLGLPDL